MFEIDYDEVKKYADADHGTDRGVDVSLQNAGVASLCFPRTFLPTYSNILANEALSLIQLMKPSAVTIRNADSYNCSQWWNQLKKPYGGKLRNVRFVIFGIRDNLKYNMLNVTPVLKEAVATLASKKPLVFYVKATEYSIVITTVNQTLSDGRPVKVLYTFEIELVGDWNWRSTFKDLLAEILPSQFCNLRKIYFIFEFKCLKCIKRVFEQMNWSFPDVHRDAKKFMNTVEADDLYFDSSANRMQFYDEFNLAATNTKVRYFFQERKPAYGGIAGNHDPNYQTLAGVAC